jgi:hypothetical protein
MDNANLLLRDFVLNIREATAGNDGKEKQVKTLHYPAVYDVKV